MKQPSGQNRQKKQSEGVQVVCLWYLSYLIIC